MIRYLIKSLFNVFINHEEFNSKYILNFLYLQEINSHNAKWKCHHFLLCKYLHFLQQKFCLFVCLFVVGNDGSERLSFWLSNIQASVCCYPHWSDFTKELPIFLQQRFYMRYPSFVISQFVTLAISCGCSRQWWQWKAFSGSRISKLQCVAYSPSKWGLPLEFINIQPPKRESTSSIHQHTSHQKGGPPLEFINQMVVCL